MVDKPLFTPGPLTTSRTVKAAMSRDLGSRDTEFIRVIRDLRNNLLQLSGVSQADGWEAVLMQGSGTFSIESVISSIKLMGVQPSVNPSRCESHFAARPVHFSLGAVAHRL